MRTGFTPLIGMLVLFSSFGCANGKQLQEKASKAIQQAYYITEEKEGKKDISKVNFYLEINPSEMPDVEIGSVFFLGKEAQLLPHLQKENLYIATFEFEDEKNSDFIMSSDPLEEYGNKPPAINRDFPFELDADEAMISFKRGEKTFYHKISGVQRKDDIVIKNPENIRH